MSHTFCGLSRFLFAALVLLPVSCSAQEESTPLPATPNSPTTTLADAAQFPQIQKWLQTHQPAQFTGKTWARFKISEPLNFRYNVIIDSETNPYKPERTPTGTVWASGLQIVSNPDGKGWGKPLPWVPPASEADWLCAGEYSTWVEMPVSKASQWHSAFIVRPKDDKQSKEVTLHLEFASAPTDDAIFYSVAERADEKGSVLVRMPTEGGVAGMKMVEGFSAWAKRRRRMVAAMKLPSTPHIKRIRIGTWSTHSNYRAPGTGGSATREQAEPDFQTFADLGLNGVTPTGLNQTLFKELAEKYNIQSTTLTGWAGMWRYTPEGYSGKYNYLPGETPAARWTRVFDDYYAKMAARFKIQIPTSLALADHLNLGDEVHPATSAKEIRETPELLAFFRAWLQKQNAGDAAWTPQFLGAKSWQETEPTDDRKEADNAIENASDTATLRRYYWTWRFINDYSVTYYKAATTAARRNFPHVKVIAVNYQSGPVQNGFLGQNNAMANGNIDIFEIGRQNAMQGVMMEDWVASTDLGAGFSAFGADVMRAGARKHDLPLSAYVVGYSPRPRFYAWMMQGVKEFGLYLYGPVSTIGPAWADQETTQRQIATLTREVQKFDEEIAAARLRPTKAAMLIANTSDIMQRNGMYFSSERQQLYVALRHSGIPVDLVSEQDIADDDLLRNYSLLYVVDPQVRADVQRKIAAWVEAGGNLWAGAGAMNWDEYSQPSAVLHPAFGVSANAMAMQAGDFRWGAGVFSARIGKFKFTPQAKIKLEKNDFLPGGEITAWGARINATPTTGRVMGSYEDGTPAIIRNTFGKGTALLAGVLAGEAYVRERYTADYPVKDKGIEKGARERALTTALIARAKIEKPVELSSPGIYSSVMDAPNCTLVFLNKAHDTPLAPVTVRLQYPGRVSAVESAKHGALKFQVASGVLQVQLPLEDADILCVRNANTGR